MVTAIYTVFVNGLQENPVVEAPVFRRIRLTIRMPTALDPNLNSKLLYSDDAYKM